MSDYLFPYLNAVGWRGGQSHESLENLSFRESHVMAIKLGCPHCKRVLNVSDKAFGRTVPCPVLQTADHGSPQDRRRRSTAGPDAASGANGRQIARAGCRQPVPGGGCRADRPRQVPLPRPPEASAAATAATASADEAPRRRAVPWLLIGLAGVVLLAVIGVVSLYVSEGSSLGKAIQLIDDGNFREAAAVLRPLQGKSYFHRPRNGLLAGRGRLAAVRLGARCQEPARQFDDRARPAAWHRPSGRAEMARPGARSGTTWPI